MLNLRKVAITGGLSCGKSSVCRILKDLGAYVVSADTLVHQLLSSDITLGQEIIHLLGSSVWVNNKLDHARIANIVFENLELLDKLEELIHPIVYRELEKDYQRQQNLKIPPSLFIAEIPLLFESDGQENYDAAVAVIADPAVCCDRFEQTTGQPQLEFYKRTARQLSLDDKARLADYVIINNGTLSDLQQMTKELYQELIKR